MRYGSPLGAGFGDPENAVAYLNAVRAAGRAEISLTFRPAAGCGGWFGVYANSRLVRNVYAAAGVDAGPFSIPVPAGAVETFIALLRLGALSDPRYQIQRVARMFEAGNSRQVTLAWKWQPEAIGVVGDAGQTYNWALSKIKYSATQPRLAYGNWSTLRLVMDVDATDVTLSLYCQNTTVARGGAALASLPASVTLAEVGDSGVAASCNLYAAPVACEALLELRWPVQMNIRRDGNVIAAAPFNQADTATWTEPAPLEPGDYVYVITPFSDSGEEGASGYLPTLTIVGPPAPPTNLHYVSGDATATVIGWTASATAGATYNVYTAAEGVPFDLNAPDQTLPAGSVSATLGAFAGVPGVRAVLVRAVSGGIEETNLSVIRVEFDGAGGHVAPRPGVPQIIAAQIAITAGCNVSVPANYPTAGAAGAATGLQLFTRAVNWVYDFGSPDAAAALSAGVRADVLTATLAVTYGDDGPRYVCVRAVTADGTPGEASDEVLIDPSAGAVPAPVDVEGFVSRG